MSEHTGPGFKVCDNKGFHLVFPNGWTASVQWGRGNYCTNHNHIGQYGAPVPMSATAEIAAYDADGNWYDFGPDTVCGYVCPAEVARFVHWVSTLKRRPRKGQFRPKAEGR